MMTGFIQDIRFGVRQLRRSIGFTAVAAFTLALGIGANTAIFSLVSGILLRPLPYPRPAELVSVTGTYPKGAFAAMREQVHSMQVAAYAEGHEFNLAHVGDPVRLTGTMVSAELLSVLGAQPELGRVFTSGEDAPNSDNFVILSHDLWAQRFGSDPTIIGRSIELEGVSRQVVGVMPSDFRFPSQKTQLWVPLHNEPGNAATYWAGDFMPVIGRLRPGSTMAQAGAEIRLFQSHAFALFPWTMPSSWNADVTVVSLRNGMVADVRTRLLLLLGAVALVLLIACANVANLTLSRAATREKEMGIRAALGAAPRRIARQLLTESVLLAIVGAALGLGFAAVGLHALKMALPAGTPRLLDVHLDWRVLLFTGTLAVLTGLAFGLAPALQSSRSPLADSLNAVARGAVVSVSRGLRGSLAVAEVALSVLLVIAAGLLIRSFWSLSHVDTGFQPQQVLTARITPDEAFCSDPARCLAFYRNLLDHVRTTPGISRASLVNTLPLGGRVAKRSFDIENFTIASSTQTQPLFWLDVVTSEYFRVMGIPLVSGRSIGLKDTLGAPLVAMVNEAFVHQFFLSSNPLGHHLTLNGSYEIVGVVRDALFHSPRDQMIPFVFISMLQVPDSMALDCEFELRTRGLAATVAPLVRQTVVATDSRVTVTSAQTLRTQVLDTFQSDRVMSGFVTVLAALALIVAGVGLYGVVSHGVARRTKEIGLRRSLGATPGDVVSLIVRETGARVAIGLAVGSGLAAIASQAVASQLFGIGATDGVSFALAAALLALVALCASVLPALRALRIQPSVALRAE